MEKYIKYIKIALFISMLILIYLLSPKLTYLIQEFAKYIYELDCNYITRIIELLLVVILTIILVTKKNKKEVEKHGKVNNRSSSK